MNLGAKENSRVWIPIYPKDCWNHHFCVPLYTEFHSKQSFLKFCDQSCPKKAFQSQNLRKQLLNSTSSALNAPSYQVSFQTILFQVLGPNFPKNKYFGDNIQENKRFQYLGFWIIVKQFPTLWVIVGHNMNVSGHCGLLQVIVAHSTVEHSPYIFA